MKNKKQLIFVLTALAVILAIVVFVPAPICAGNLKIIPPSWSAKLNASTRFKLVLDDEAVLDKETGIVWELVAGDTDGDGDVDLDDQLTWNEAIAHCYNKVVGDRKGMRLPSIEELLSLIDPNAADPALPAGHPFIDVQFGQTNNQDQYLSSTTQADSQRRKWTVEMDDGNARPDNSLADAEFVWCVRAGRGWDGTHDTGAPY